MRYLISFIILASLMALSGCQLSSEEMMKASKNCEANGGLDNINVADNLEVACKNGARFHR